MRVSSEGTQKRIFIQGEALQEGETPDHLALYLPDGTPINLAADPSKMKWRGEYDASAEYVLNDVVSFEDSLWIALQDVSIGVGPGTDLSSWQTVLAPLAMRWQGEWEVDRDDYKVNDVVLYDNSLWIAPGSIEEGTEPGWEPEPPTTLFTNRGVVLNEADRFNSLEPVLFEIVPGSSQYRDNDIAGGHGAVIYIDKSGALPSGTKLVITPVSSTDNGGLDVNAYYEPDFYRPGASGTLNDAAVDAQTPLELDIYQGGETDDLIFHVYFGSAGADGSFTAHVTSDTNLVGPPVVDSDIQWELVLEASSGGGGGGGDTEDWHIVGGGGEPTFQNSWSSGSPAIAKFRKRSDGMVELRGFVVKSSGSGQITVFTLPSGYRPASGEDVLRFPMSGASGGYAEVFENGEVKITVQAYVSLDPIQFSVD